ncbi:MAG: ABC transporter permease [Bryobacteraceae bacterium]|jgi:predicted permease
MPDFRAYIKDHLPPLGGSGAKEAEIIEELALDFEERYKSAIRGGLDPGEAWRKIQSQTEWPKLARDFTAMLASAQPDPPKRLLPVLNFWNDVRYAARTLRKNPGFTAVAVFTLALCLGANLTIFAVVDSILLRSLPFPHADRLVTAFHSYPKIGTPHSTASLPNYYDYREKIKAFASTAIITENSGPAVVGAAGSPYTVERDSVSPEFFSTLGVKLLMGRSFTDEEMVYSRSGIAILTYPFWRAYFNLDPNVIGRTFQMDGSTTTVVGVLPPNFRFLSRRTQLYIPAASAPAARAIDQRHNNTQLLIARLAPGATIATARAQIAALNAEQIKDDPFAENLKAMGFVSIVSGLREDHVAAIKPTLLLLQGGGLLLLLIGSVNLVNLLLIRASGRARELAIRQSLGASHWHVMRQVMTETVLLCFVGGLCGLALAAGGIGLLQKLGVDQLPLGTYIGFDAGFALVALSGTVVLGVLIALPVAWFSVRVHLANAFRSASRSATTNRAAQRLRHSFIVAQICLAFVLLAGAGLLGISLKRVMETSPGFQPGQVLAGQLSLPYKKYPDASAQLALIERLLAAIRNQPGVAFAGIGNLAPFGRNGSSGVTAVEGVQIANGGSQQDHYRNGVVGAYWRTLDIPLLRGRLLEDADNQRKQRVCVVDQAFANRYWPGGSPLGRRLNDGPVFNKDEAFTIVGVVGTVKQNKLDDVNPKGTIYYPYKYWPGPAISVLVRTGMAAEAMVPILRRTVLAIDPELPIDDLKPMRSLIAESVVTRRSPAVLAGIFAVVALLLTAVGTYGVLAYAVGQRRREIGVRMALGAGQQLVLRQFLGLAAKLLLAGIGFGILGAWATGRAMQHLLFGIGSVHFGVVAAAAGVMIGVVLLATSLPSYSASRVSPTEALRDD